MQLSNNPIYEPEDSDQTMQALEWASYLSIIVGALNTVPLCDLDQPMLKKVMAENRGLVSYIPTSAYFTKRVHIKCRGCPTLWGCRECSAHSAHTVQSFVCRQILEP